MIDHVVTLSSTRAAAIKPFDFIPYYYPGPGLGGHCIPIDPFYLTEASQLCAQELEALAQWPRYS